MSLTQEEVEEGLDAAASLVAHQLGRSGQHEHIRSHFETDDEQSALGIYSVSLVGSLLFDLAVTCRIYWHHSDPQSMHIDFTLLVDGQYITEDSAGRFGQATYVFYDDATSGWLTDFNISVPQAS